MSWGRGSIGGVLNEPLCAVEKKQRFGGDVCCSTAYRADARVRGPARASHWWTAIVNAALFVAAGCATWLHAWQPLAAALQKTSATSKPMESPAGSRTEVVQVLTEMALGCQRKCGLYELGNAPHDCRDAFAAPGV